jgi:hypothetical protein
VEITHPFHPLCGKRFPILKSRCVREVECLVLKGSESGTFSVPRDWTDQARPDPYLAAKVSPCILKLESLLSVLEVINVLAKEIEVDL